MQREITWYSIGNRRAVILQDHLGYILQLFEDSNIIKSVDVRLHTLRYAEDCAENWVQRIGSFKESN